MFLRWGARGGRKADDGKFRSRPKMGLQQQTGGVYRDWTLQLVFQKTGTAVRRQVVHVAIHDPHGNRIEYLRDFSSVDQATRAGREWIDARLEKLSKQRYRGGIGTVPRLPTQEQDSQEK